MFDSKYLNNLPYINYKKCISILCNNMNICNSFSKNTVVLMLYKHLSIFARDIVNIYIVIKLFDGFVQALFQDEISGLYITFIDYDGVV